MIRKLINTLFYKRFLDSVLYRQNVLFFLFVVFFTSIKTHSQQTISTTQFLGSLKDAHYIKSDSVQLSQLQNYNYNLPLFNSIEFRTESRDLMLQRQEYALRIKPNSLFERAAYKNVYQNKIKTFSIENQENFNTKLEQRYLLLIDFIFSNKKQILLKEKQQLLEDKSYVLSQGQNKIYFDIQDLINTENDVLESTIRINNLTLQTQNYLEEIKQHSNQIYDSISIETKNLIKPNQVLEVVTQNTNQTENTEIKVQELKIQTLEREMQSKMYQKKQILDYVQVKYGGKKNFIFNENFSIGIGISLPFFEQANYEKGKYLLDIVDEERELTYLKEKNKTNLKQTINTFILAKQQYKNLNKQAENNSITPLLEKYQKMEGVSPLVLLKLKILQQKIQFETLNAQQKMYRAYINYLSNTGLLFQQPYRNYLSEDFGFF